jgi:hypothetical protein
MAMQVGDRVRRRTSSEAGVVVRLSGELCEVALPSGRVLVHQDELEPLPSDPAALLAAGELGRGLPFALRLQALYLQHAYRYDPLSGLSNARIEPTLHQVYIAHLLTQKLQPRMILADEVGLGKTIEAGLVIKELRARGLIERVLVVVPASLQLQWQQELRSKFNEQFEIVDGSAVKFLGKDGSNPWTKRPNVICSTQFARNASRAEKIIEADWDLVAPSFRPARTGFNTGRMGAWRQCCPSTSPTAGISARERIGCRPRRRRIILIEGAEQA